MICLTETRVTDEVEDFELMIKNYTIERNNSNSRFTGGVVFYVRNNVSFKKTFMHVIDKNLWLLVIKLKINGIKYTVAGLYHSPSGSHSVFLDFFENWLDQNLMNSDDTILIMGDFNINWQSDNTYTNRLKRYCNDYGLRQIVNSATRIQKTANQSLI